MNRDGVKNFVAGGISGGIGVTVVYPIDLVKTRLQNQITAIGKKQKYKGALDCFFQTIKREGFKGLYKGLRPQLLGVAPEKAIKLTVNDTIKSFYPKTLTNQDIIGLNIISGSVAGLSQVIVTNPLEMTKIQLQIHGETYSKKSLSLAHVIKKLGIKGLYRGSRACMMRDIPFSGIYFPLYSYLRNKLMIDNKVTTFNQILVGTVSGICASSITTPADVIKTRLQIHSEKYKGIKDCYFKMVKNEGYRGLFKGVVPRVSRSAPQFGITLYFYEMLKENF